MGDIARQIGRHDRAANKRVAAQVEGWLRREASGGSPAERRFAEAFGGRATQKTAKITVRNTGRFAGALATVWGALARSGWYAAKRFDAAASLQHPKWVGATWRLGDPNQGPYIVRDVIPDRMDDIAELYADERAKAFEPEFPKGV